MLASEINFNTHKNTFSIRNLVTFKIGKKHLNGCAAWRTPFAFYPFNGLTRAPDR